VLKAGAFRDVPLAGRNRSWGGGIAESGHTNKVPEVNHLPKISRGDRRIGEGLTMQDHKNGDTFTRDLFAWLHQVNADSDLPAAATKIALAIGYHINRGNGEAWPSTVTLAEKASVNKSTASRMVRLLETCGHLSVENGKIGRGHPHRYRTIIKGAQEHLSEDERVRLRNGKGAPTQRKGAPTQRKGAPTQKNYLNNQLKNQLTEPSDSPAQPSASLSDSLPSVAPFFEQQEREAKEAKEESKEESAPQKLRRPPRKIASVVPDSFNTFWDAYPRHKSKGAAEKAYIAALKIASAAELLAGAQRYATERNGQDPNFTKYPASWINAKCWTDEPAGGRVIDQAGNPATPRQVYEPRMSSSDRKRQVLREAGMLS
jgi:hypothetical protein